MKIIKVENNLDMGLLKQQTFRFIPDVLARVSKMPSDNDSAKGLWSEPAAVLNLALLSTP